MKTEYKYYLSTDDRSYGESSEAEIAQVRKREREICEAREIEIVECDPMIVPHYENDEHPDSESIFEDAVYYSPTNFK